MKRLIYSIAGGVAFLAVAIMIVTAWMWPVLHEVKTGQTPEYPEIQPHYYSTDSERIYLEAVASVEALSGWTVVDEKPSTYRLEAERTSAVWGFVDDVTIQVEPVTEFVSQIQVHSRSKPGIRPTDFGQNARNIREFLTDLDDRLGAVKFEPNHQAEPPAANGDDADGEREVG